MAGENGSSFGRITFLARVVPSFEEGRYACATGGMMRSFGALIALGAAMELSVLI